MKKEEKEKRILITDVIKSKARKRKFRLKIYEKKVWNIYHSWVQKNTKTWSEKKKTLIADVIKNKERKEKFRLKRQDKKKVWNCYVLIIRE